MERMQCGECGEEIPYLSETCPSCGKAVAILNSDYKSELGKTIVRSSMEIAGGAIPLVGGIFSAAASAWEGHDQENANAFFKHWLRMLFDEMREKEQTIVEIMARLDMHDAKIEERMKSSEYQSLIKKAFREWPGAESEEKRKLLRNILSNAAASTLVSDDVIKLFLDWLKNYSELHFKVIGVIYNKDGITRGEVWGQLGKQPVREDSAEADLFKLLFRGLSTGAIIRQHKERDYEGNVIVSRASKRASSNSGVRTAKSAFDEEEEYELTGIGEQFVHYAMTELSLKIEAPKGSSIG